MIDAYFEDIREVLAAFGRDATSPKEMRSEFFRTRSENSPGFSSDSRRFSTAITSTRNPANGFMFGAGAEVRWYHRQKSIISCRDNRCVAIFFGEKQQALTATRELELCANKKTCILDASIPLLKLNYFEPGSAQSQILLELSAEELEHQLHRVGDLWNLVFPKEHAIVCRTISYTVPKKFKSVLFSTSSRSEFFLETISKWFGAKPSVEKRAFRRLSSAFSTRPKALEVFVAQDSLKSLYESHLTEANANGSSSLSFTKIDKRFEAGGLSTYDAAARIPECLNFSGSPALVSATRGDRVHAYLEGDEAFFRDFVLKPEDSTTVLHERHAEEIISHIMAFRRSGLFRNDFAKKIYNVTLPSILLRNKVSAQRDLLLIPHIVLYRTPILSSFRRTFSLSFICIPVSAKDQRKDHGLRLSSRMAYLDEIHEIDSSLRKPNNLNAKNKEHIARYELTCRMRDVLNLPTNVSGLNEVVTGVSVGLLEWINEKGSGRYFSRSRSGSTGRVAENAYLASLESQFSTKLNLVNFNSKPKEARPWEEWLRSNEDASIRDAVYKRLFHADFIDPTSAYTTKSSVKLEQMLVGNRLRTDMNGMTFLDPSSDSKLILYPAERESFPNYSILRWLGFSVYQDSAIACLQEMIREFNREIDQADDTLAVLSSLEGMLQSFGELYDLDIRYSLYRDEYENVRDLINLDRDYQRLHERFNSVKEEAILREQRLFNKLLLSLAVVTILFGIIQYAGTRLDWSSKTFAIAASMPLLLVAALIFKLFDPIRVLFKGKRGDG